MALNQCVISCYVLQAARLLAVACELRKSPAGSVSSSLRVVRMRSWSTITTAVVALTLGAASAAAEVPTSPRSPSSWEQPSIGRLGPLGTSNSLFELALSARTPTTGATSSGSSEAESTDSSKHVPAYLIAGGAAIGLGVFIAAVSGGGSSADLVSNPPGTPSNPNTPGGNTGGTGGTTVDPSTGTGGNGGTIGDPPSTTTPEPASMALLASGLASMGGFQLRRHRKRMQNQD